MISLVDMRTGNLNSVRNAFSRAGAETKTVATPDEIAAARVLVLPGVGAFETAMVSLRDRGLVEPIRKRVLQDRIPLLGICLGMQLMADESEEGGRHAGLGLIAGRVIRLKPDNKDFRVPNIGWYEVRGRQAEGTLHPAAADGASFYFVHSYWFDCAVPEAVAGTIDYSGRPVVASVEKDNIFGVQFHPEKSQDAGLDLIARFLARVS